MGQDDKAAIATEQMFALVGRAITQWSFVEERLCSIFTICTSAICARPNGGIQYLDSEVPMTVFYSVENFRGKLGLVDAAISARFIRRDDASDHMKAEWAKLREKARKLSLKRNRLAHWTVLPAVEYEGLLPARLVPPFGSPGYYRATGSQPDRDILKVSHVAHLEYAFYLLSGKLAAFAQSLAQREELFDRAVQLAASQIRSYGQLDQNRAERLRRALSFPE